MLELLKFFNINNIPDWVVIFIVILLICLLYQNTTNRIKEGFAFIPWNMGTRFFPSYDLRGYPNTENTFSYPLIYPWNYPYPGYPYLYWSPFYYEASGKYKVDPKHIKPKNKTQKKSKT